MSGRSGRDRSTGSAGGGEQARIVRVSARIVRVSARPAPGD
ncbi:hypothetical protein [Micromonospora narathiwatensis]|nr:hypothetical protein [Micromonospora narathiwatensis]